MPRIAIILISILAYISPSHANDFFESLPSTSQQLDGYFNRDSVEMRLAASPLHRIEGIWQFPDNGAQVVIERFNPDKILDSNISYYRIIVLRAPVRSLLPGTTMGYICPSADKDAFTAKLYTRFDGGQKLSHASRFVLTLTDDGHLSFERTGTKISLKPWRLLPYVWRLGINVTKDEHHGINGCIRLFPPPINGPIEPRYL